MHSAAVIPIVTLALAAAPILHAQDFLSVPEVVTSDPALFADLFARPRTALLHAAMIGDSQETCPLGHGTLYMPAFNAAWADRYGACGRTPLVQPGQTFGGGAPDAEWLVRGLLASPFINNPSPATAPDALPGLANWLLPAPTGAQRGWFALLQPRATSVAPSLPVDRTRNWLDVSQGVYIDVYAQRDPAYGDISARWSLCATAAPSVATPALGQGVTDLAAAPGTSPVARHRFGPITWNAASPVFLQAEFTGAEPDRPARIVSVSFASVANPIGLAVTDIAAGGYTAASLTANHAAALDHLSGLELDCVFMSFGAIDGWTSPAAFKQAVANLIAAVRAHTSPNLPVILLGDPYNPGLNTIARGFLEQFPRISAELAAESPAVCAVNSRRLVHQQGWTTTGYSQFVVDGTHYNAAGATLKAGLEVDAIWRTFVCPADVGGPGGFAGGDGLLDNNDFIAFITAFFEGRPIADTGRAGGLPLADGQFDNNDFVAFINAFFAACP